MFRESVDPDPVRKSTRIRNLDLIYLNSTKFPLGVTEVKIESFDDAEAAGEGATLANWTFDKFKKEKKPRPLLLPIG